MGRDAIIARLREHETTLCARGVSHAAQFGPRARGDARPKSDADILIEIDPSAAIDLFAYAGLKRLIEDLLPGSMDVVNKTTLKPRIRPSAEADAIYAFCSGTGRGSARRPPVDRRAGPELRGRPVIQDIQG